MYMSLLSESHNFCNSVFILISINISWWSCVSQFRCPPICRRPWWKSSTPRFATSRLCTEVPWHTTWCAPGFCRARWTHVRSVLFYCASHKGDYNSMNIKLHFPTKFSYLGADVSFIRWWSGLVSSILSHKPGQVLFCSDCSHPKNKGLEALNVILVAASQDVCSKYHCEGTWCFVSFSGNLLDQ